MKNFWRNKKILITGGAGFIGSNLSNDLIKYGAKVFVIDNLERGLKKNLNNKVIFYKQDLRKKNKIIGKIFKNKDIIIHLASKVGAMHYYQQNQFEVMRDNIAIDNNTIELAYKNSVKSFMYASSSHVYPLELQKKKKYLLSEKDSIKSHPIISYGWAKLVGEKQIEYLSNKFENTVILRFVGIYGNNQDVDIANGSLIPVLSYKSLNYPSYGFKLLTDGSEIRTYCHIDDTIDAIKKIIISMQRKKYNSEAFNICSDDYYSIYSIAKKISKLSKKNIQVKKNKLKANIKCQICDNSKLKRFIKWQPKITIDEGLKAVYDDLKTSYSKKIKQNKIY